MASLWKSKKSPVKKESGLNPSVFYQKEKSWKEKLMIWIRLNILVPDAKIGWRGAAAREGIQLHRRKNFDVMLSTSPPPTTSLVALKIARKTKVPWVADFRDPWTQIYYYEAFPQGKLAAKLNARLEKKVVRQCDALVCVNDEFFNFDFPDSKYFKIPNGFDAEDFEALPPAKSRSTDKLIVRYMGTLKMNQFSPGFIEALKKLGGDHPDQIQFDFYGRIDPQYQAKLQAASGAVIFRFPGLVPHREAIEKMAEADLLMLIIGTGAKSKLGFSTKIFEYIYTKKPILAIAHPDGAAAQILKKTGTGFTFNHHDAEGIFRSIESALQARKKEEDLVQPDFKQIEDYSFEKLTDKLDAVLKKVLKRSSQ